MLLMVMLLIVMYYYTQVKCQFTQDILAFLLTQSQGRFFSTLHEARWIAISTTIKTNHYVTKTTSLSMYTYLEAYLFVPQFSPEENSYLEYVTKICPAYFNEQSPCESSPCENGGTCRPLYETDDYICLCRGLWVGTNCEMCKCYCIFSTFLLCLFLQTENLSFN